MPYDPLNLSLDLRLIPEYSAQGFTGVASSHARHSGAPRSGELGIQSGKMGPRIGSGFRVPRYRAVPE
jgi:hypothetical protein